MEQTVKLLLGVYVPLFRLMWYTPMEVLLFNKVKAKLIVLKCFFLIKKNTFYGKNDSVPAKNRQNDILHSHSATDLLHSQQNCNHLGQDIYRGLGAARRL